MVTAMLRWAGRCGVVVGLLVTPGWTQTANLDGETNLKIRMSPKAMSYFANDAMLQELSGTMECAAPNKFLEEFNSRWKAAGSDSFVRRLRHLRGG